MFDLLRYKVTSPTDQIVKKMSTAFRAADVSVWTAREFTTTRRSQKVIELRQCPHFSLSDTPRRRSSAVRKER